MIVTGSISICVQLGVMCGSRRATMQLFSSFASTYLETHQQMHGRRQPAGIRAERVKAAGLEVWQAARIPKSLAEHMNMHATHANVLNDSFANKTGKITQVVGELLNVQLRQLWLMCHWVKNDKRAADAAAVAGDVDTAFDDVKKH